MKIDAKNMRNLSRISRFSSNYKYLLRHRSLYREILQSIKINSLKGKFCVAIKIEYNERLILELIRRRGFIIEVADPAMMYFREHYIIKWDKEESEN